jgi:hypothetical protein
MAHHYLDHAPSEVDHQGHAHSHSHGYPEHAILPEPEDHWHRHDREINHHDPDIHHPNAAYGECHHPDCP